MPIEAPQFRPYLRTDSAPPTNQACKRVQFAENPVTHSLPRLSENTTTVIAPKPAPGLGGNLKLPQGTQERAQAWLKALHAPPSAQNRQDCLALFKDLLDQAHQDGLSMRSLAEARPSRDEGGVAMTVLQHAVRSRKASVIRTMLAALPSGNYPKSGTKLPKPTANGACSFTCTIDRSPPIPGRYTSDERRETWTIRVNPDQNVLAVRAYKRSGTVLGKMTNEVEKVESFRLSNSDEVAGKPPQHTQELSFEFSQPYNLDTGKQIADKFEQSKQAVNDTFELSKQVVSNKLELSKQLVSLVSSKLLNGLQNPRGLRQNNVL